jgi:hypothetical protein
MGNEKWMGVHLVLLTLFLGSYIWEKSVPGSYTVWKIYITIDTLVYLLMAFIMDQVNGPQYTVWANRKFVGKNQEEVAEHILHDRSSINDISPELSENLTTEETEEREIRPIDVSSNSIFEELEPSSCTASIEGIA